MLPVLYLAAVTAVTALVLALRLQQPWGRALLVAAAGTLAGVIIGAAVGAVLDVATTQGDALQPSGAIGAIVGAAATTIVRSADRRRW